MVINQPVTLAAPGAGLSAAPDFDDEQHDLPRVSWRDHHPGGAVGGGRGDDGKTREKWRFLIWFYGLNMVLLWSM